MRALVIGVSGLVGRAVAASLADAGYTVRGLGRSRTRFPEALAAAGVEFVEGDRNDDGELDAAVGGGADVVIDCVCYTARHAMQLVTRSALFGSAVVISSKAVYVDAAGRHANSSERPVFDRPVREDDRVMAPDWSGDYDSRAGYGANKVAAELVLQQSGWPVTILRPSRVHGVGGTRPREWFFVRRILDGRLFVPLLRGGRTANSPTAASNIAALTLACANSPSARVLNVADPDAPTAADVAAAVAAAAGSELTVVRLGDDAPKGLGGSPWSAWPPFLTDVQAASRVPGYRPTPYPIAVQPAVRWLLSLSPTQQAHLNSDPYFTGQFDYATDDRALRFAEDA